MYKPRGGAPTIEVATVDRQPEPVPGDVPAPAPRGFGKLSPSEAGKLGGVERWRKYKAQQALGLKLPKGSKFATYRTQANDFLTAHLSELAKVAGGSVGPGPSSMAASAALQLAASRWMFDTAAAAGDPALMKQASTLANDSRQNLLAAYELAVREAQARGKYGATNARTLAERLLGEGVE